MERKVFQYTTWNGIVSIGIESSTRNTSCTNINLSILVQSNPVCILRNPIHVAGNLAIIGPSQTSYNLKIGHRMQCNVKIKSLGSGTTDLSLYRLLYHLVAFLYGLFTNLGYYIKFTDIIDTGIYIYPLAFIPCPEFKLITTLRLEYFTTGIIRNKFVPVAIIINHIFIIHGIIWFEERSGRSIKRDFWNRQIHQSGTVGKSRS